MLSKCNEDELRSKLKALFRKFIAEVDTVEDWHGSIEYGVDMAVSIRPDMDILGHGQILMIQAKTGNITKKRWDEEIRVQIETMYENRLPSLQNRIEWLKRYVLMTSGEVRPEAILSIDGFNGKKESKLEVIPIDGLVNLFLRHGYSEKSIIEYRQVGEPQTFQIITDRNAVP